MTFRPPLNLSTQPQAPKGLDLLEAEILADKAASLGGAGRRVEHALKRLREHVPARDGDRETMLRQAAEAVWGFQVQRELCGFRDWHNVVRDYDIPREVLVRLGRI